MPIDKYSDKNNSTVSIKAGISVKMNVPIGGQGDELSSYIMLIPVRKTGAAHFRAPCC